MGDWHIPFAEGDMAGENGDNRIAGNAEGEPGKMFMAAVLSIVVTAEAAN